MVSMLKKEKQKREIQIHNFYDCWPIIMTQSKICYFISCLAPGYPLSILNLYILVIERVIGHTISQTLICELSKKNIGQGLEALKY